jgi:hypothetical protein
MKVCYLQFHLWVKNVCYKSVHYIRTLGAGRRWSVGESTFALLDGRRAPNRAHGRRRFPAASNVYFSFFRSLSAAGSGEFVAVRRFVMISGCVPLWLMLCAFISPLFFTIFDCFWINLTLG